MESTSQPQNRKSLLLDVPDNLLSAILSLGDPVCDAPIWLWLSGSSDLQRRLPGVVTRLALWTGLPQRNGESFVNLNLGKHVPNYLDAFPRLVSFRLQCSVTEWDHMGYVQVADALKRLPSTLEHLEIQFHSDLFIGGPSSSHLFNPTYDSSPSSRLPLIELEKVFPNLVSLILDNQSHLRLSSGTTQLPDTLKRLRCPISTLLELCPNVQSAKALPRGLESWVSSLSLVGPYTSEFLDALPRSLVELTTSSTVHHALMSHYPEKLASMHTRHFKLDIARALPSSLTSLKIDEILENDTEKVVEALPPTLTKFCWNAVDVPIMISKTTLQLLPRGLLKLECPMQGEAVTAGDFPPGLTSLALQEGSESISSAFFAAALPQSLLVLKVNFCLPTAFAEGFMSNLPRGLQRLGCYSTNIADSETLAFPPRLTSLGTKREMYDNELEQEELLFPYEKLPRTLTELHVLNFRIAKMHLLPPLNYLRIGRVIYDGFDPKSKESIDRALILREFGLTFEKRSAPGSAPLASQKLEQVGFLDLLPKTLEKIVLHRALEGLDDDVDRKYCFPYLPMYISCMLR